MPAAARRCRILELCFGTQSLFDDGTSTAGDLAITCFLGRSSLPARRGPTAVGSLFACIADYRQRLPFAAGSFELVFIHDGLDRLVCADSHLRRREGLVELLARIGDVVVPGGVFVASAGNRSWPSRWKRLAFGTRTEAALAPTAFSVYSCRDLLERCGFSGVQVFNVVPSHHSPLRLINTDADLSRVGFRRELETIRPYLAWPRYLARRVLVELSLNRFLEESLLFWGHKQ